MTIINKLFEIQKMNLSVEKDGINPHFKSNYITLDNLVNVLQPICNDFGILVTHATNNLHVVSKAIDIETGEFIESSFPLSDISNPQKVGSAITYAKRYNLCQIFNIITDRDDDGNKASIELPNLTEEHLEKLATAMKSEKPPFKSAQEAITEISKTRKISDIQKTAIEVLLA